jgi:hypothetical protein
MDTAQIPLDGGPEFEAQWEQWAERLDAASTILWLSWLIDHPETDDAPRAAMIERREEWMRALPLSPDAGESIN